MADGGVRIATLDRPVAGRAAPQKIVPVRRTYNRWVANQTLEDYALRFTAKGARRWSCWRVANTALGSISFLALEAIGGAITLGYGASNAVWAILAVGLLIFATGLPISFYAARYGVDIDLLTRGAGFGYIGSTITSLIYASFTFIFFALEAVILAMALEMLTGLPPYLGYLVASLVAIPLVTYGITGISRFQLWTQPVWLLLHAAPFLFVLLNDPGSVDRWLAHAGPQPQRGQGFDLVLFGAAATVVFSLVAQIGEQVDFLRFLPPRSRAGRVAWWGALLAAGPGWILLGTVKLLAGSFLVVLALDHGVPAGEAAEPTQMYLVAFRQFVADPNIAIVLTALFVIVSQLKINVTNAYAGSIAWSNFFSRLTHSHPGRVVWLVFNVAIALLLMEMGIYDAIEQILALYSNIAVAWVGALVADLVVNKPLGLSPPHIEFKRAHLYDINPVGVGAMGIASLSSVAAFSGLFGGTAQVLSPFIALTVAFVTAPLIAWATGGRYYIARSSAVGAGPTRCRLCELVFEPEDMAQCPAYGGAICSLCCSLDARCHDLCKTGARIPDQVLGFLSAVAPARIVARLNSRLGHYLALVLVMSAVTGAVLWVVFQQAVTGIEVDPAVVSAILWKVFLVLVLVIGVVVWLFVLAQESRRVAEEESRRQTELLVREIEAHERTDAQLQRAKEAAEAANLAKSRYVVGISHEIRAPLNAIFGYAQLLERDPTIPEHRQNAVRVIRRSVEHLSGLIDGLLDISKIEAGRLQLHREEVRIHDFLAQIMDMFRLQAAAKGIGFHFAPPEGLPAVVHTDESRLRQILINLLSNAIKFTDSGQVSVRVRCRSQVAEFEIADTGAGIAPEDLQRIFEPFVRARTEGRPAAPGMGLGLTITKLLAEVMGGEISVESTPGKGSVFRVKVLLSEVMAPRQPASSRGRITGYEGPRRTVLVADDDPAHRDAVTQLLTPLGLTVFTAEDGGRCLEIAAAMPPDVVLLDIQMPRMDGWAVARALREAGSTAAIVMVSANAGEMRPGGTPTDPHDGFVSKPFDLNRLLDVLHAAAGIVWTRAAPPPSGPVAGTGGFRAEHVPPPRALDDLLELGRIGYVRGIQTKLDELSHLHPECAPFIDHLRQHVRDFALNRFMASVEAGRHHDG